MRNLMRYSVLSAVLCIPLFAAVEDSYALEQWLIDVLQYATTVKGVTVLAGALGAVQLLMKLFQTPLGNVAGKYRLLAVSLFSVVAVVLGGLASGLSLVGALLSGSALLAFQVLVHRIYTQFFTKND